MRIIEVDDPIKIILTKQEVEQQLINDGKINEPMSLQEFIKFLDMQNYIFVKDDTVVPFRIYNDMLFIVADKSKIEIVDATLKSINYSFDSLTEITMNQVYKGELDKYNQYFIINSKYMVNKK